MAQLCANCGAKVSSWTGVCPECGADPRTGKPLSRVPPAASSGEPRVRDPIAPARTATASVPVIVRVSPIVVRDYPIDLRAARPERSSRLWAALTILWIKFVALIPHFFILTFLAIAQFAVALVAQLVVAVKGEYPPGMHAFVVGVLRWQTRVSAFIFSLTDRYPPFSLKGDDAYPIDVVVERPACSNRLYALATVLVEFLAVAGAISLLIYLARWSELSGTSLILPPRSSTAPSVHLNLRTYLNYATDGLILRQLAAFPHYFLLSFVALGALVVWALAQWAILFRAVYPQGMYDFVAGFVRWQLRVDGYALGLVDRYPPFTMDPSIAAVPVAPAAWYADPTGRHGHRYWDGWQWTPHVADNGQATLDPVVGPVQRV